MADSEDFDYQKVKKALEDSNQLPREALNVDRLWEAEVREKKAEDELNPPNESPEKLVKLEEGDYDYYKAKRKLGFR